MNKVFYLLFLLHFVSVNLFSQDQTYDLLRVFEDYNLSKIGQSGYNFEYEGTPYLFDEELKTIIVMSNDVIQEGVPLRYNAYDDRVEMKVKDQYYILEPRYLIEANIDGHVFVHRMYAKGESNIKSSYFERLNENDKCTLYMNHNVEFIDAKKPGAYADPKPAMFVKRLADFYISTDDGLLQKVGNKKDFLELIPDQQEEVAVYIKKNKIKFKKSEDLLELVNYYNSL